MRKLRFIPLDIFLREVIASVRLQTTVETLRVADRVLVNEDHVTAARVCRNQGCPIREVGASQDR